MTHQQISSAIRKEINAQYKAFKEKHSILKYQNFWGFLIFFVSIAVVTTTAILWKRNIIPTWLLIVINAFFFGVLHELEHDLIHWMYFKNNKIIHHGMLLIIWLLRPLTINPWIRRQLHYHHHKFSGTLHDVEERGVTNGEKWSIKRFLFTPDLVIGGLLRVNSLFEDIKREMKDGRLKMELGNQLKRNAVLGLVPVTIIAHVILYIFVLLGVLQWFDFSFVEESSFFIGLQSVMNFLQPYIYIILLPNVLRQFCLHFITSNIHYFADVEEGNVIEQTQVLNVWWTFPFHVFCFFFGWTHAIHHFVVNETFYVRHLTRKKAQTVLKENGVRFNDLGTFRRANRFHELDS